MTIRHETNARRFVRDTINAKRTLCKMALDVGKVGEISEKVIELLGLSVAVGTPIFIGETNTSHMKNKHLKDFERHGTHIADIIAAPDYVGINDKDNSLEYLKGYFDDETGEYVKIAVRVSTNGKYFARSLYSVSLKRIQNRLLRGTLHVIE